MCKGGATALASGQLRDPDGMTASVEFIAVPECVLTVKLIDRAGKLVEKYEAKAASVNNDCPTPYENNYSHGGKPAVIENIPACDYRIIARTPDGKEVSTNLHLDEGTIREITLILP